MKPLSCMSVKERRRAVLKRSYEKNRVRILEKKRLWRLENPEKYRERSRRQQALQKKWKAAYDALCDLGIQLEESGNGS
jgi:hypothetical protein